MRLLSIPAIVIAAGVVTAAPVPKAKEEPAYFPVTVGDSREYEWRTGGKAEVGYSDKVVQADKQPDGSTHVTLSRPNPNGEPTTTVVAVSAAGLSRVAEGGQMLDEPIVLLKLPAKVGTAWEVRGAKYEVTAVEEVKVAAGTYKAVKVERAFDGAKSALWFAPAVGLVRMTSGDGGRTLELKSFKPGK